MTVPAHPVNNLAIAIVQVDSCSTLVLSLMAASPSRCRSKLHPLVKEVVVTKFVQENLASSSRSLRRVQFVNANHFTTGFLFLILSLST